MLSLEGPLCISESTEAGQEKPREADNILTLKSPLPQHRMLDRIGKSKAAVLWSENFSTIPHEALPIKSMQGVKGVVGNAAV